MSGYEKKILLEGLLKMFPYVSLMINPKIKNRGLRLPKELMKEDEVVIHLDSSDTKDCDFVCTKNYISLIVGDGNDGSFYAKIPWKCVFNIYIDHETVYEDVDPGITWEENLPDIYKQEINAELKNEPKKKIPDYLKIIK